MDKRRKIAAMGATALLVAAIGTGVAVAGSSDDDSTETAITGDELRQASDAALQHTGEGRVTGSEVGDEESYYEVEVTLNDGSQVDVQLDRDFNVVGSESEGPEAEEDR